MSQQSANTGVRLSALVHFHSTGLVGTGAQQTIAHGLSFTPALVIPILHDSVSATWDLTQAADDQNIYITVTDAAVFDLLAL